MHPREQILQLAKFYRLRDLAVPADVLAQAERYGLDLTLFDQPKKPHPDKEGEDNGS